MRYQGRVIFPLIIIILVGAAVLYFAALRPNTSLTQLQQQQVIRIGYALEAPYAYLGANGDVTGEAPEVAKAIVAALDIPRIEWVQTDFDLLISGLLDQRYDVIAAGMFITPERAQLVQFSNPDFHAQPGLLVRAGNPLRLHSYQDVVDNPAAKVAVISGAVEESDLRAAGAANDQIVVVPDALTGQTAVTSGLADGLALSAVTVRWIAAHDPTQTTEVAEPFTSAPLDDTGGYGGFAFRPADTQLIAAWNDAMTAFIGSPEHVKLIGQFGFTVDELPGNVTTAMVLKR